MSNMKFRPSNSDHGEAFTSHFCDWCARDHHVTNESCEILFQTQFHDIDDPEYPAEWTYDESGSPVCTAFKHV